jgi:hypothetical protein
MNMIEEKMVIDFSEYLFCFNDTGEVSDAENAQCCIKAINEAVNRFITGASTIAHHGFNLNGKGFHMDVDVSLSDDDGDSVSLYIRDTFGVSAEFIFDATMKLVMTKTNNCVVIDCNLA